MMRRHVLGLFTFPILMLVLAGVGSIAQAQTQPLVLYNFNNIYPSTDPYTFIFPTTLAQGLDGNIYATSVNGGDSTNTGAFFSMTPTTPASTVSLLYQFDPNNPAEAGCQVAQAGVNLGSDGNFHSAFAGCTNGNGDGEVISLTTAGGLNMLYNFTGGNDGSQPIAAPVEGTDGNYYGITAEGGAEGCGTIYQFVTATGVLNPLYQFQGAPADGCVPYSRLTLGTDGNFYGTTVDGGKSNFGIIFKITPSGQYNILYSFDGTHGASPYAPLIQAANGNFYGTAYGGGTGVNPFGVVFEITPAGRLTVLHTFYPNSGDGAGPVSGLVQANDGYFYGVTELGGTSSNCGLGCGTIFRLKSKITYETLYSFDGIAAGSPEVALLQHTNGLLYGLSDSGGTYSVGTFYSLDMGLKPFVSLVSTSGAVGSAVGILGQDFSSESVVKFDGVEASTIILTGATFITAIVPSGAKTGLVTVENARGNVPRTLLSNKKFNVTPPQ